MRHDMTKIHGRFRCNTWVTLVDKTRTRASARGSLFGGVLTHTALFEKTKQHQDFPTLDTRKSHKQTKRQEAINHGETAAAASAE
jgi:hypothetical protein